MHNKNLSLRIGRVFKHIFNTTLSNLNLFLSSALENLSQNKPRAYHLQTINQDTEI